eukprot:m.193101 g.193101  ORF g.193101 m.193101 type:complete len:531 (+) comp24970_c0_seq1:178-1770(+)
MERTPLLRKGDIQDATTAARPKMLLPFVLALIVSLGAVSFGYALGFTSPLHGPPSNNTCGPPPNGTASTAGSTIPTLRGHHKEVSDDVWTWFGSLVNIGAMVGAVLGTPLLEMAGRKGTIILSTLPMIGGFWLIFIAGGESGVIELLAGRVLTGIGVGLTSVAVPTYIAEIAPPEIRGGLGSIFQLGVVIGVMQAYAVGDAFPQDGKVPLYQNMAWVGTLVASALFVLAIFIPMSPRWQANRGNMEGARKTLEFLRGSEFDVDGEIEEMRDSKARADAEGKASLSELFSGATLKAMGVMTGLMLFQQLSGINSVIFFSGNIFAIAGLHNSSLASVILGVTQVIITMFSCLIIDKAGRRALLMVAGIGMTGMLAVLGLFYFQKDHGHEPNGIVAIVAVIGYIAFFSLGLGAIPWLMCSEVFPLKYRAPASSLMTLLNWTLSFIITKTFQSMVCSPLQSYGTFWFYGGICILGVLFVLTKVPETRGKTLEEIETYFKTGKGGGGAGDGNKLVGITSVIVGIISGVLIALLLK